MSDSWEGVCCEYVPGRRHITIYPPGTDAQLGKAEQLALNSPATFRAAQELLEAAEKFVFRRGWFTSAKKRYDRTLAVYARFIRAFITDAILLDEIAAHGIQHVAIEYLDEMSAAFPDWRDTYAFLDFFIWECVPEQFYHGMYPELKEEKK